MAGGQAGERPGEGLTGGLSGGEWWRVEGPWRVLGAVPESAGDEDGVYLSGPAVPPRPTEPAAGPEVPVQRPARAVPSPAPERPAEA
ncbi:hypothetical protein ACQRUO_30855, partial [Kitasatospora sp. LaBMicrA B282]